MKNTNYTDEYRFSPYDNKANQNYPKVLGTHDSAEDYFWGKLFVSYPPTCWLKIKDIESAVRNSSINSIMFYGYSGTGKTTFLHYVDRFYRKKYSSIYESDFINLIQKPSSTGSNSLMVSYLDTKIKENLTKEVAWQFIDIFDKYKERNPLKTGSWDSIFLKDIEEKLVDNNSISRYNYYPHFQKFLGRCAYQFSLKNVQELCDEIDSIPEKIAFYVISFILKNSLDKNHSVFIFDNLDELDEVYLSHLLETDLYTAYSKAQSFFETFFEDYEFTKKCTFIKSIRITSSAFRDKSQLNDRIRATSKEILFDCFADSYEVIKRRSKEGGIIPLIKMEKVFLKKYISRLYNYDMRAILFSFGDVACRTGLKLVYKNLEEDDCKVIGRGCILYRILQARNNVADPPFMNDATEAIILKHCDVLRMAMTLLANMTNNSKNGKTSSSCNKTEKTVSLLDFTERIVKWYGSTISVKKLYKKIFVSSYHNYSMPATLTGPVIEQYIKNNRKNNLQEISDYCADLYDSNPSALDGVEIIVHPLCEIYATHVFIHYEYFNSLSLLDEEIEDNLKQKPTSLLECNTLDDAIRCMERVYRSASKIIKTADDNFCQKCEISLSCNHGRDSLGCKNVAAAMDESDFLIKKTLYASRVITSHINYLDSYRRYIWKIRESSHSDNMDSFVDSLQPVALNDIIVEYIKKYVRLCSYFDTTSKEIKDRRKVYDITIANSIRDIETNLLFLQENKDRWIPIKGHNNNETQESTLLQRYGDIRAKHHEHDEKPLLFKVDDTSFLMMPVESGSFEMGSTDELDAEKHTVYLNSYYLGETPVTQRLWRKVMGTNPSLYSNENNPVERVSWEDCSTFINKLNDLLHVKFRLPTEAEWEYAAKGGKYNNDNRYSGSDNVDEVAWHEQNSDSHPHPVKRKLSNALGIYDMSGNVCEWCSDWYGYFSDEAADNPKGPEEGKTRVIRGGSWFNDADYCIVTSRYHYNPLDKDDFIGFRLALDRTVELTNVNHKMEEQAKNDDNS